MNPAYRCAGEVNGQRCRNIGSISLSTKGDQWYCRKCFSFLKGTNKPRDKELALNTVHNIRERLNKT